MASAPPTTLRRVKRQLGKERLADPPPLKLVSGAAKFDALRFGSEDLKQSAMELHLEEPFLASEQSGAVVRPEQCKGSDFAERRS
jgi:hypothetical protein